MKNSVSAAKKRVEIFAIVGCSIDIEDIIIYILNGLTPNYLAFKIAIRTKLTPINLDDLHCL